jgi:hypothetical protein
LLHACSFAAPPGGEWISANGSVDGARFAALAESHGVAGYLAGKLRQGGGVLPFAEWAQDALLEAHRRQSLASMALVGELFRVQEILQVAQIPAVVVKGPVLSARAFGDPGTRYYGDIDFLLRNADIARASQLLVAAGFQPRIPAEAIRAQKDPGQYVFRRAGTGCLIELHTERTLRYFPRPLPIEDFFLRKTTVSIDGRSVPALALEDEFVLISIHGAKHFWERLMWICDVAALVHRYPEMDWVRVRRTAADVGAERMTRVALLLAERLLDVPILAEMKKEVDADRACLPIVKKIGSWLPYAGQEPPQLVQRALFRLRMRGRLLDGARYLTRLSLSPTEEDWSAVPHAPGTSLREPLGRPFRLAKKYRRSSKGHSFKEPD